MKFLKPLFGFVGGNWLPIVLVAAAAYIGLLHLQIAGEKRHSAKVEIRLRESNAAYAKLEADIRSKTALAQAQDAAHAAQDKATRTQITVEVQSSYAKETADLRRRYDALLRLRAGATTTSAGGGGNQAVPDVPDATPGVDDSALEDGLLASEIALRLKALQEWVKAQAAVGAPTP